MQANASPARTALTNSQLTCGERHAYFGNRTLARACCERVFPKGNEAVKEVSQTGRCNFTAKRFEINSPGLQAWVTRAGTPAPQCGTGVPARHGNGLDICRARHAPTEHDLGLPNVQTPVP